MASYAELHCHTHFSFLDGASPPDELVERAVELGLSGLAVTDHNGLYGVVRFATAAAEAGLRPIVGVEIEMADAAALDPAGVVVPVRRGRRGGHGAPAGSPGTGRRHFPAGGHGTASGYFPGVSPLPGEWPRDDGLPARPRPNRALLPGHRDAVKEDAHGVGEGQRGPHLVLLARNAAGYRSLCRLVSRANLAGTKAMPRFSHELLAANTEGLVALSGCREGEIARRLRAGDREGARAVAERYARLFGGDRPGSSTRTAAWGTAGASAWGTAGASAWGTAGASAWGTAGASVVRAATRGHDSPASASFFLELQHHLLPDDDWLVSETVLLAEELGLPVVVTNDVHYAYPEGRELQDVLTAIRHGRTLDELRDLRRPSGEEYLKSGQELLGLPPGPRTGGHSLAGGPGHGAYSGRDLRRASETGSGTQNSDARTSSAWAEGISNAGELAASCSVDLGFERYRFPGFPVPKGHTPFSYLEELCHEGARRRYHPIGSPVVKQLAHELDVIERTGLAEFFLICWDIMRFAKEHGIPAQGRGSAADSIVAYVLGITRVDPIRHNLLFERFINEGRTTYPDVDIDFSSERREEVIQYVYRRYGPEHTGMVCNLVTYRARSAVREVGYTLGFPRALVDRVAKALETYDSVMVRRDLEAEGGFAQFFAATIEREAAAESGSAPSPDSARTFALAEITASAALAQERGLTDRMGQLNHPRGGRIGALGGRGGDSTPESARSVANTHAASAIREPGSETGLGAGPEAAGRPIPRSGTAGEVAPSEPAHGYHSPYEYLTEVQPSQPGDGRGGAPAPRVADLGGGSALEQQRRMAKRRPIGSDTEGGPGDSAASIAWLAEERRAMADSDREWRGGLPPEPQPHSSVARVQPLPPMLPDVHRGSTANLPHWERWLEFCARIDGFPRHLSIHTGGMLVTAAPLIDIAPLERATMPNRVVVQFDKRDVETIKLIKLDLLGLGMLAAIDETLQLIESDCATCVDLDRLPEDVPEVFEGLCAADTVGVFQVESRAQMQTLPKSRPSNLDDLVVEVAIIRPGPIQGNAVHPYLRRRQGLEPVTYLHPSLEPVLRETLGVILYQEQVMQIAITVAGFSAAESDGFRRAMGTWRSSKEMEKLHQRFVDGCEVTNGLTDDQAEELFRQVAAFASFGFAKSHAAAFARTAYESAFLRLFYPAQFTVGLINAQPMGFYPVEVLINDAKRHGVAVLPVDVNASSYRTTTEWVGPGKQAQVRSSGCIVPTEESRRRWAPEQATGFGIRLGLALVKGIGPEHADRLDAELARGPYATLADVVDRTALPEETIEALIRAGALDSLGRPRREMLWQLREVMGATRGSSRDDRAARDRRAHDGAADGRTAGRTGDGGRDGRRTGLGGATPAGRRGPGALDSRGRMIGRAGTGSAEFGTAARARVPSRFAGARPLDLRLPPTPAPDLPEPTERERLGDSYAVLSLDAKRQVVSLFRPALDRLGAVTNASLSDRGPGPVRLGGLVVTRQHPMTARGTVFLALEDETGMVNVTLWPDAWARLRSVVRRHALLYVEGMLQREANVVNVVAREIKPLPVVAEAAGGPPKPEGVRALGYSGMRRGQAHFGRKRRPSRSSILSGPAPVAIPVRDVSGERSIASEPAARRSAGMDGCPRREGSGSACTRPTPRPSAHRRGRR
jgi:DNA polymerase III alpha subunit